MSIKKLLLYLSITLQIKSSLIFKMNGDVTQCFIDELFQDSSMIIKWKIFTYSRLNVKPILPFFTIYALNEESKEEIFNYKINLPKSKTTFTVKKAGQYRICAKRTKYNGKDAPHEIVYMNMKLLSENMDEIDFSDVVSNEDLNLFDQKSKKIKELTKPILTDQTTQLEEENNSSVETIENTKWYKYMAIGQVAVTLFIGIVQLRNFRRFLKSQNVI